MFGASVWEDLQCWARPIIENKINLTFYSSAKSQRRVLNKGLAKIGVKELIYNVTSAVFHVIYTNKRNTCKASYALWF